ncbi:site-2 protease family protein, partial [Candidatus Micrarchaeota archaeon]|nr:site-2 protease family protein [Candidatus Micrarchaeota archaeon]
AYSFYLFWKKEKWKFFWHSIVIALFVAFLALTGRGSSMAQVSEVELIAALLFGFLGLGAASIIKATAGIFTAQSASSAVAPIIPGITPGIPLLEGIIALGIIMVVHEVAHGVLSYIAKIRVESSGILLLGFLPIGAFVEPDEEQLKKLELHKKRRIIAAGSTSNFIFFIVFAVLMFAASIGLSALSSHAQATTVMAGSAAAGFVGAGSIIYEVNGERVRSAGEFYEKTSLGSGFLKAGDKTDFTPFSKIVILSVAKGGPSDGKIPVGANVSLINGVSAYSLKDVKNALAGKKEGDSVAITFENGTSASIVLGKNALMGVSLAAVPVIEVKTVPLAGFNWLYAIVELLQNIFQLTAFLNLALALTNMLPILITDGQQLVYFELREYLGAKREKLAGRVSLALGEVFALMIVANLLRWLKII